MNNPFIIISSKIRELFEILKTDDKVTDLPDDIVQQINQEFNLEMDEFRQEFSKKEEMSNRDTSEVILNS
jgi:hypothetical protein